MAEGTPVFICNEFNECYKTCCFRDVKRFLGMESYDRRYLFFLFAMNLMNVIKHAVLEL
jgi:hypothetical protein